MRFLPNTVIQVTGNNHIFVSSGGQNPVRVRRTPKGTTVSVGSPAPTLISWITHLWAGILGNGAYASVVALMNLLIPYVASLNFLLT